MPGKILDRYEQVPVTKADCELFILPAREALLIQISGLG
jgi:hypothetical protein